MAFPFLLFAGAKRRRAWLPGTYPGLSLGFTADPAFAYRDAGVAHASDGQTVRRLINRGDTVLTPYLDQATAGSRPTLSLSGGLWGLDFAMKSLQALFAVLPQPLTVYIVFDMTSGTYIYDDATSNAFNLNFSGGFLRPMASLTNLQYAETQPIARCQCTYVFNGASSTVRKNGVTKATGDIGTSGLDGLTLGTAFNGTAGATWRLSEMLVYSAADAVGGVKMLAIEAYLKPTWGTP